LARSADPEYRKATMTNPAPSAPRAALSGVKVLDLAMFFPAPYVAAMLGDFGADVVKCEPLAGDGLRGTGAMKDGESYAFAWISRNKRSLRMDFDKPEGLALLHQLTSVADVIILNQTGKLLSRWGCSYDEIAKRNPRAVVLSLSAFGEEGPYAGRSGNGTLCEAYAGISNMVGETDGPPMLLSVPLGDVMGAISGLVGTLMALYWRDANKGEGQRIDASIYEGLLPLLGSSLASWQEGTPPPRRMGSRMAATIPRNAYRSRDGRWLALSASTDPQIARILELLAIDTPENRARFGTMKARMAHVEEMDSLMSDWIGAQDCATVLAKLGGDARISVAEINDLDQVMADPNVRARGSITRFEDPRLGTIKTPAPTPRLTKTPGRIARPAPALGEHTEAVCRDWLGLSDADVESLRHAGAI